MRPGFKFRCRRRLSQSPSLLISGSGSWPQREGLFSPAAHQIYRRNFPPVPFIQSRTVLLMRRQSNPITPHKTWLELFWSKFNWTVYFLRAVFWFCFIARIQIQSFSGRFIFLHLSTLARSDFPCTHGPKKHYRLVYFWARALQTSFMAYANLATSPKRLETELTNITRRHFCSLPVFCNEHSFNYSIYFLLSEFFSDMLWQLGHTHATTHSTGTQIVRAKMMWLDAIFCRGNKLSSRSLARFCRRRH